MSTDRIEQNVLLHAPIARVWRALSDSAEFGSWFGMKFDRTFKPHTRITGQIAPTTADPEIAAMQEAYAGLIFEFIIEDIHPEKLLSFRWHPHAIDPQLDYSSEPTTLVVFTLEEREDGVLLTVVESGFERIPIARRETAYTANEGGWGIQMRMIAAYLARIMHDSLEMAALPAEHFLRPGGTIIQ
jgi:uncharacterized protein YndB with AHSA1/START domain